MKEKRPWARRLGCSSLLTLYERGSREGRERRREGKATKG
jgi:hypothetical protein